MVEADAESENDGGEVANYSFDTVFTSVQKSVTARAIS